MGMPAVQLPAKPTVTPAATPSTPKPAARDADEPLPELTPETYGSVVKPLPTCECGSQTWEAVDWSPFSRGGALPVLRGRTGSGSAARS